VSRGGEVGALPQAPCLPTDDSTRACYLEDADGAFGVDAYHSASIEGHRVAPEPFERVQSATWDTEEDAGDRQQRDALAARSYRQADHANPPRPASAKPAWISGAEGSGCRQTHPVPTNPPPALGPATPRRATEKAARQ